VHPPPPPPPQKSLAALFASDPECKGKARGQQASRAMQFAGAQPDDELELKKLQVRWQGWGRQLTALPLLRLPSQPCQVHACAPVGVLDACATPA
jgi:hypothetical protein